MRQQSEPDRCLSAYQQLLATKSNKMTICHLSLVSISAISCDVKQQNANAPLSDITEERKVGQEVDEEEEVVEVDLGKGEQYVQI